MDGNVKPGDTPKRSKCCYTTVVILKILLCPIWWPLLLVLGCPIGMAIGCAISIKREVGSGVRCIIGLIAGFICGLIGSVCWIPLVIGLTFLGPFVLFLNCVTWICGGCKCGEDPETENRKRA